MAATERGLWHRLAALLGSLLGGLLAAGGARAVDLPEDRAEAMIHSYNGGGVTANGPALLVRKSVADRVSLSASYYVDAVSNASIDVVTTASPYREQRTEYGFSADYVYRDSKITFGTTSSHEPDYTANAASLDITQEVFGGMTTVSARLHARLRQGRQARRARVRRRRDALAVPARRHADPDAALDHERQLRGARRRRLPRQPVPRRARVRRGGARAQPAHALGARRQVPPERRPRLARRDPRRLPLLLGHLGHQGAHRSSSATAATSATPGWPTPSCATTRQGHALFYSDNAPTETTYVSRNRQLSTFNSVGLGAKLAYTVRKVPGQYEVKLNGGVRIRALQVQRFHRHPHRQPVRLQRQRAAAVRVGHLLTDAAHVAT